MGIPDRGDSGYIPKSYVSEERGPCSTINKCYVVWEMGPF